MTPEKRKAYVEASRAHRAKLRDLAEQYGEIPQGERPAREISLPKQTNDDTRVRRFARTAAEASTLTDEQAGAIEQAVLGNLRTRIRNVLDNALFELMGILRSPIL